MSAVEPHRRGAVKPPVAPPEPLPDDTMPSTCDGMTSASTPNDPKLPVLGVSACIFRARKVLLVQRANPPFEGLWSLPGGRVAFGERLEEAVRREVGEETGIELPRFAFYCLHEAIEAGAGIHAVIAVHRAAQELPVGIEPVAGDDARAAAFHPVESLSEMDRQGLLTGGLAEIVASAHRSHLLGL